MSRENVPYLAQLLTNIETIFAEVDRLYLELQAIRLNRILINRKLNKAIINIYELLDSAISLLFETYQIKMGIPTIKHISYKQELPFTAIQNRRLFSLIRKIHNKIDLIRSDIKKLKKKVERLHDSEVLRHVPPDDYIIDFYDLNQMLIIITTNLLIIKDFMKNNVITIPSKDIQTITCKRGFVSNGCEIKLTNAEKIKLPFEPDILSRINKILNIIKKHKERIKTSHIRLATKRSLVRPDINNIKIAFLKAILSKQLGIKTRLI